MTPELKVMMLLAVLLGLGAGVLLAVLEQLPEPRVTVIVPEGLPPHEVAALMEEARRITRAAAGD